LAEACSRYLVGGAIGGTERPHGEEPLERVAWVWYSVQVRRYSVQIGYAYAQPDACAVSLSNDRPTFSEPHIKGAVIRPAREWIIRTFGRPIYDRAISSIRPENAAIVEGEIVSVGWYPLEAWNEFRAAFRRELRAEKGIEATEFDRRCAFEAGPQTLAKVYRFVLSMLNPVSAVEKLVPIYKRVYSHGDVIVLSHREGKLTLAFTNAPLAMQEEVKRMFPISAEFLLSLAGQEIVELRSLPKTEGTKFSLQLQITYRKSK
jgi:hypothetical protein